MAKNKNKKTAEERKSAQDYYKLHSDAVNDLVTANEENSPEVSAEELRKYRSGSKIRFGDTFKALFIKFWFNGMTCFFFYLGLGYYIRDFLDQLFVFGFALGVITDILVNNILRFVADPKDANDKWMMVPKKQLSSLFINILYAYVVLITVYFFYNVLNLGLQALGWGILPVEPILFGLIYLGFDLLYIRMKKLMKSIINDAKEKV